MVSTNIFKMFFFSSVNGTTDDDSFFHLETNKGLGLVPWTRHWSIGPQALNPIGRNMKCQVDNAAQLITKWNFLWPCFFSSCLHSRCPWS